MKAIVCDKCGKVLLLEDIGPLSREKKAVGIYTLLDEDYGVKVELCKECGDDLVAAVRETKEGSAP